MKILSASEKIIIKNPSDISNEKCLFVFEGPEYNFSAFINFHQYIKNKLWNTVHPKLKIYLNNFSIPPIVMNIRRGKDFRDAVDPSDFYCKINLRTPISWFKNSLQQIRNYIGMPIPALIVTDGNKNDMKDLLHLPNVILANSPAAITDLFLLSQAKVILGSGGSAFSAWGSFLSKAVTITIPGQGLKWYEISNDPDKHYVGEFDPSNPDEKILKIIYSSYFKKIPQEVMGNC